jgi:hypothetical protein
MEAFCLLTSCPFLYPLWFLGEQEDPKSAAAQVASRKDKSGNPFEFFQLLFSLVKRW